jgi:hypothetical protein
MVVAGVELRPTRSAMTRLLLPFLLASTFSVLGTGCGPVDEREDAGLGLRAMLAAVGPVDISPLGQPWADPNARERPVAALVEGGEEGEMHLSGSRAGHPELDQLYNVNEFDLHVEFRRCAFEGIVLGGAIDYGLTMEAGPSNDEPSLEWSYVGEIKLRGDARGRCEVDLVATGAHTDAFAHADARTFMGTMCGFDVEDVEAFADLETVF